MGHSIADITPTQLWTVDVGAALASGAAACRKHSARHNARSQGSVWDSDTAPSYRGAPVLHLRPLHRCLSVAAPAYAELLAGQGQVTRAGHSRGTTRPVQNCSFGWALHRAGRLFDDKPRTQAPSSAESYTDKIWKTLGSGQTWAARDLAASPSTNPALPSSTPINTPAVKPAPKKTATTPYYSKGTTRYRKSYKAEPVCLNTCQKVWSLQAQRAAHQAGFHARSAPDRLSRTSCTHVL